MKMSIQFRVLNFRCLSQLMLHNKSSPHSVADNKDLFFSLTWLACVQGGLSVLVSEYGLAVFDSSFGIVHLCSMCLILELWVDHATLCPSHFPITLQRLRPRPLPVHARLHHLTRFGQ